MAICTNASGLTPPTYESTNKNNSTNPLGGGLNQQPTLPHRHFDKFNEKEGTSAKSHFNQAKSQLVDNKVEKFKDK